VRDEEGVPRMVREMGRGQVIGEMSLYTDEPRSASVVAIRDSVLVRWPRRTSRAAGQRLASLDGADAADHPSPADAARSQTRCRCR